MSCTFTSPFDCEIEEKQGGAGTGPSTSLPPPNSLQAAVLGTKASWVWRLLAIVECLCPGTSLSACSQPNPWPPRAVKAL